METEKDLNRLTERASDIKGMIEHPGWKDVILPILKATCDGALQSLRVAKTPEDLQKAQTALLSAEFLLGIPDVIIADGVDASEQLDKLKE